MRSFIFLFKTRCPPCHTTAVKYVHIEIKVSRVRTKWSFNTARIKLLVFCCTVDTDNRGVSTTTRTFVGSFSDSWFARLRKYFNQGSNHITVLQNSVKSGAIVKTTKRLVNKSRTIITGKSTNTKLKYVQVNKSIEIFVSRLSNYRNLYLVVTRYRLR